MRTQVKTRKYVYWQEQADGTEFLQMAYLTDNDRCPKLFQEEPGVYIACQGELDKKEDGTLVCRECGAWFTPEKE